MLSISDDILWKTVRQSRKEPGCWSQIGDPKLCPFDEYVIMQVTVSGSLSMIMEVMSALKGFSED